MARNATVESLSKQEKVIERRLHAIRMQRRLILENMGSSDVRDNSGLSDLSESEFAETGD
jgi:hypothetical protein